MYAPACSRTKGETAELLGESPSLFGIVGSLAATFVRPFKEKGSGLL